MIENCFFKERELPFSFLSADFLIVTSLSFTFNSSRNNKFSSYVHSCHCLTPFFFNFDPIQRLLNNILSADDDERCLKDIGGLMAIIRLLMVHLKPYDPEYEQVVTWTHKLCVDYNLGR